MEQIIFAPLFMEIPAPLDDPLDEMHAKCTLDILSFAIRVLCWGNVVVDVGCLADTSPGYFIRFGWELHPILAGRLRFGGHHLQEAKSVMPQW